MNKDKNIYLDQYIQQIKDAGVEDKYSNKAGIYAIKIYGQIVYVGKSTNLIIRIASHMKNIVENTEESKSNKYQVLKQAWERDMPVEFNVLYYTTKKKQEDIEEDIGETEGLFIRHYMPLLNYQIPKAENWRHYTTNKKALEVTLDEIMKIVKDIWAKNC